MLPLNPWEHHFPMKALYSACMEPVCKQHSITRTELDILLFLVNNPNYDTAADIIEVRRLAKSHVSTSLKALELAGFLEKHYYPGNRKTAHLSVCSSAAALIADGRKAQEQFFSIICDGLSMEEIEMMQKFFSHIQKNIKHYLEVNDL